LVTPVGPDSLGAESPKRIDGPSEKASEFIAKRVGAGLRIPGTKVRLNSEGL